MPKPDKEVPIHIDNRQYKSPEVTTGAALYQLGGVGEGYDLFQEVHGPGDDFFIPNDGSEIHLKPGTHFYTAQSSLNPGAYHGH